MQTVSVTALKTFRHIMSNGKRITIQRGKTANVDSLHVAELKRAGLIKMDAAPENKMLSAAPENKSAAPSEPPAAATQAAPAPVKPAEVKTPTPAKPANPEAKK